VAAIVAALWLMPALKDQPIMLIIGSETASVR
jgi:hypothetical protein